MDFVIWLLQSPIYLWTYHHWLAGPVKGADLIRLAFVTLGQHEFAYKPKYLEPVKMLGYLDDENESIRQAAALAFCRVLHRNARLQKQASQKELNGYKVMHTPSSQVVEPS